MPTLNLSIRDIGRLRRAVRLVDGLLRPAQGTHAEVLQGAGLNLNFVRVTSETKSGGPSSSTYFPGHWYTFDPDTGASTQQDADVWVFDLNGAQLKPGRYYRADQRGDAGDGTLVWLTAEMPTGTFALPDGITPTAVTLGTDQDDYALPATAWLQVTTTADVSFTGVVAPSTSYFQFITNEGPHLLPLVNQSASSSAANRFVTVDGSDLVLQSGETALLRYDTATTRWLVYPVGSGSEGIATLNLTASTNDCPLPAGAKVLQVAPTSAGFTLTGLAGGSPGQKLTVVNAGAADSFTLPNQSGSSSAGDRFTTASGSALTVAAGAAVALLYDGTSWLQEAPASDETGGGGSGINLSDPVGGATGTNNLLKADAADLLGQAQGFIDDGANATMGGSGYTVTLQSGSGYTLTVDSTGVKASTVGAGKAVATDGSGYLIGVSPVADNTYTFGTRTITTQNGVITAIT